MSTTAAWIVGNGPSLAKLNLDSLCGYTSFASQRIHLIYDKFSWRPTYYVMYDRSRPRIPQQWLLDLEWHSRQGYPCYIREDFRKNIQNNKWTQDFSDRETLDFLPVCAHVEGADTIYSPDRPTEWHLPLICKYGGSTFVAIQLAVLWGHNPIFVIGCDLGYGDGDTQNHFCKDYIPVDSYHLHKATETNKTMEDAHRIALRECRKRGISIFNATPGGYLNVYPRKDFGECVKLSRLTQ